MSTKKPEVAELDKFRAGSKKNKVYARWATQDEDAAYKYGRSVKLKESTLIQWFRVWARDEGRDPPKKKVAAAAAKKNPAKKVPAKDATKAPAKKKASKKKVENGGDVAHDHVPFMEASLAPSEGIAI